MSRCSGRVEQRGCTACPPFVPKQTARTAALAGVAPWKGGKKAHDRNQTSISGKQPHSGPVRPFQPIAVPLAIPPKDFGRALAALFGLVPDGARSRPSVTSSFQLVKGRKHWGLVGEEIRPVGKVDARPLP